MPIHDWTRVDAGVFHGFHLRWIARLTEWLNTGGLPAGYYADAEQYAAYAEKSEVDVLTLHASPASRQTPLDPVPEVGGTAVLGETTLGQRTARRKSRPMTRQRRLVIRHVSGHRVVALLEVVSPGNKDRRRHALDFANKLVAALRSDIHVTILDLFPPTPATPRGLHNEVWQEFDRELVVAPPDRPLAFTAFVADARPRVLFEFRAVGQELPSFVLPLDTVRGVMLPLAETYAATFDSGPLYLRELLSQPPAP